MLFLMKTKPTNAIILVRVSTKEQNVDRQISDLDAFADKQGWNVVETISSHVSGSKVKYQEREDLDQVRPLVEMGKAEKLLLHEVSRIGR